AGKRLRGAVRDGRWTKAEPPAGVGLELAVAHHVRPKGLCTRSQLGVIHENVDACGRTFDVQRHLLELTVWHHERTAELRPAAVRGGSRSHVGELVAFAAAAGLEGEPSRIAGSAVQAHEQRSVVFPSRRYQRVEVERRSLPGIGAP